MANKRFTNSKAENGLQYRVYVHAARRAETGTTVKEYLTKLAKEEMTAVRVSTTQKFCYGCRELKSTEDYYPRDLGVNGWDDYCKACRSAQGKARRRARRARLARVREAVWGDV